MADTARVIREASTLSAMLSGHARQAEELRTMPPQVVDACAAAGLFTLALPESLGGLECDPLTIIRVIEELSRADGSGGWTVMIGNTTAFTAWLEPAVAREILGSNPNAAMAGLLMPNGRAVPDGQNRFVVTGRWPFNSGAPHAAWFCSGIMVMDGDRPRQVHGRADWRVAFFPAFQASIIDTWHAAGLKGTGSHDISVDGIRVPEERTAAPFHERTRHEGPLYRMTLWSLFMTMIAGLPLGVARRALDEFRELSKRKSRALDGTSLADDPAIQVDLARAEADLQAARALVLDTFARAWNTLQERENSLEERTSMTMAVVEAMRLCTGAVDIAFQRAGGGALYDTSPLQRCFRDIHAAGQHIVFSHETWKRIGKSLLGLEQPTFML
ncbi:MAG TPA: acyl-CoA dehydrogenase family protein [Vicinamibacterales bacterium]|nr:acyl-CoA dehydrogenase family protein [Vicinamibacterales bacterium]